MYIWYVFGPYFHVDSLNGPSKPRAQGPEELKGLVRKITELQHPKPSK